jgi:folate-binding protein YgfZ
MLDCHATKRDEILKKLNFYKLRADVSLQKNDELLVAQSFSNHGFKDPRNEKLGYRIYTTKEELSASNADLMSLETYNFLRIENKIAEGESDLTSDKSLILEFGFEDLHAISYEKGCYIGQELTARTHYKGEIRKKLFHIKIANKTSVEKGTEISCAGKSVGIILSSIFHKDELHALALVRLPDNLEDKNFMQNLEFENSKISIII